MLAIRNLSIAFPGPDGPVRVVDDVSVEVGRGESLGIVGESGSGKSMLSLATIGLLPKSARTSGEILLESKDIPGKDILVRNILAMGEHELCGLRGRRIGMIFQEPMTALNPAMTAGQQIAEGIRLHRRIGRAEARAEALRLLDRVRIPDPSRRIDSYPHEMSGGQRQRVGIAIALALKPDLLIADEPTTALDVTVQKEILDILDELVADLGLSLILISHDLGVIARSTDRTLVMCRGRAVEAGPTETVLRHPTAQYTRDLIAALPRRARAGLGDQPRLAAGGTR
ncbi:MULTISPECIES: ATP-binding cassette domain-containing protein [Methylobacterium]|uniref:ATP-binding cassette domain-containing protein n=1 Tax=Methylobacterium TaxID=407 RepID=UPI0019D01E20|nr:ABC transporter ATP-binding protein [Methylobacterium sp. DB0501]